MFVFVYMKTLVAAPVDVSMSLYFSCNHNEQWRDQRGVPVIYKGARKRH